MSATAATNDVVLREARTAQTLAVGWMVIEAFVALAAGIASLSVALIAFGLDSVVELVSAIVVRRRLAVRTSDGIEESLHESERRTSRFVGYALYAIAGYIVVSAAVAVFLGIHPEPSPLGVLLAVVALGAMTVLWRWRLRLSERLHSSALRADAACSAVCVYLSATLLAGMLLNNLFHWWWADPVAGLAMIWWIRREAAEALEAARTGVHCADCAPAAVTSTPSASGAD